MTVVPFSDTGSLATSIIFVVLGVLGIVAAAVLHSWLILGALTLFVGTTAAWSVLLWRSSHPKR